MDSKMPTPNMEHHLCNLCPAIAKYGCEYCEGTPSIEGDFEPVQYCEHCKKAYAQHRAICKRWQTRRSFYRVASTLQKIYYMYRKKTFGRHPVKVDKFGKQIIVTEELLWDEDIVTAWDYIAELPAGLIPHKGLKGDQMELALLADGTSYISVAWMYNVIEYMLKSLAAHIEEVYVEVKDPQLEIITVDQLSGQQCLLPDTHIILKVTLKESGEQYAMDLASAQFGCFEPIIPWSAYIKTARMLKTQFFGAHKAQLMKQRWTKGIFAACVNLHAEASRTLLMGMIKWESSQTVTFRSLFLNSLATFESCQAGLVKKIEEELQKHLVDIKGELEAFKMCKLQGVTYIPPRDAWKKKTLPIVGGWDGSSAVNNKKPAVRTFKVTK